MCDIKPILIRIKEAIKAGGWGGKTQGVMAKNIGIQDDSLSRKLKTKAGGRKDELTLREFLKIAKVLGIDPALLINPDHDIENDREPFKEMLKPIIKDILDELKSK